MQLRWTENASPKTIPKSKNKPCINFTAGLVTGSWCFCGGTLLWWNRSFFHSRWKPSRLLFNRGQVKATWSAVTVLFPFWVPPWKVWKDWKDPSHPPFPQLCCGASLFGASVLNNSRDIWNSWNTCWFGLDSVTRLGDLTAFTVTGRVRTIVL